MCFKIFMTFCSVTVPAYLREVWTWVYSIDSD
jgi:hypothetical protein